MYAAAHGLTWLASNLADRGPVLLVVDDVHWADAPSLRWLAQLARRLDEQALGVLVAVRAGEPAGEPELLAELRAIAAEPPLRPRPLARPPPRRSCASGCRRPARGSRTPATPSPAATRSCSARSSLTWSPSGAHRPMRSRRV